MTLENYKVLIGLLICLLQVTFNDAQQASFNTYDVYNATNRAWWGARFYKFFSGKNYIYVDEDGLYLTDKSFLPWDEYLHFPNQAVDYQVHVPTPGTKHVNGTTSEFLIPDRDNSPDFRIPESPMSGRQSAYQGHYHETYRYYRIHVNQYIELMEAKMPEYGIKELIQCYGTLVYKRLNPIAMTAQLTFKHALTTALATDFVVKRYKKRKTLENILGWWYHISFNKPGWLAFFTWQPSISQINNESYYATPARIHYHPKWNRPELVNRSFPLPCVFDLAVLTATFHCVNDVQICQRACPGYFQGANRPPVLIQGSDHPLIVGVNMVMDINRKPFPWFRYVFRVDPKLWDVNRYPCPKSEWGWFICLEFVGPAGKWGVDVGAMLHTGIPRPTYWSTMTFNIGTLGLRYKGLLAINSFSMRLRSKNFVNYFTILDRHPVLDFLYAAYMGRIPYAYLDFRFVDTQWRSPKPKILGGQAINIYKWRYTTPRMWTLSANYYPFAW